MIDFECISKEFQGKEVLSSVSGTFRSGQTNLIIGGSGMGKTVLVKCIIGLIVPNRGTIHYDGRVFRPHARGAIERAVRREIGMLFQGVALFDSKNVEENVGFPLDILSSMTAKEKLKRVNFCLDRVGLLGTNKKMPSELSGGMKKRIGIARAIANQSKYLFCDEPNSGLDPQTALRIDQLIAEITQEYQITTVVITHDMNSVMEIGGQIIFLHQGRKLWEGNNTTILNADIPELRDFMLSSKLIRTLKGSQQLNQKESSTSS